MDRSAQIDDIMQYVVFPSHNHDVNAYHSTSILIYLSTFRRINGLVVYAWGQ